MPIFKYFDFAIICFDVPAANGFWSFIISHTHIYKLYIYAVWGCLDFCSESYEFSNVGKLCCLFVFLKLDLLTFLREKHAAFVFIPCYLLSLVLAGGFACTVSFCFPQSTKCVPHRNVCWLLFCIKQLNTWWLLCRCTELRSRALNEGKTKNTKLRMRAWVLDLRCSGFMNK